MHVIYEQLRLYINLFIKKQQWWFMFHFDQIKSINESLYIYESIYFLTESINWVLTEKYRPRIAFVS